mmetsp:Transcript_14140/g.42768  ORF Transcript_14140/g.42768 Transcript_14140/m.42768 type:complete len:213 (+) Transcript_14140:1454-2092(+)
MEEQSDGNAGPRREPQHDRHEELDEDDLGRRRQHQILRKVRLRRNRRRTQHRRRQLGHQRVGARAHGVQETRRQLPERRRKVQNDQARAHRRQKRRHRALLVVAHQRRHHEHHLQQRAPHHVIPDGGHPEAPAHDVGDVREHQQAATARQEQAREHERQATRHVVLEADRPEVHGPANIQHLVHVRQQLVQAPQHAVFVEQHAHLLLGRVER